MGNDERGPGRAATVVLVHGSWHGAWAWDDVCAALSSRDVDVLALDLPGRAKSATAGAFDEQVAYVREVVSGLPGEVVLVGHSAGGAVITEASAALTNLRRLMYVAAFMPDVGEVPLELAQAETGSLIDGNIVPVGEKILVTREAAVAAFYSEVPADVASRAADRLVPESPDTLMTPARAAGWRSHPSTYVLCTEDLALLPAVQRRMSTRADEVVELPCGHSPMLTHPDALADLIAAAAGAGTGARS